MKELKLRVTTRRLNKKIRRKRSCLPRSLRLDLVEQFPKKTRFQAKNKISWNPSVIHQFHILYLIIQQRSQSPRKKSEVDDEPDCWEKQKVLVWKEPDLPQKVQKEPDKAIQIWDNPNSKRNQGLISNNS